MCACTRANGMRAVFVGDSGEAIDGDQAVVDEKEEANQTNNIFFS